MTGVFCNFLMAIVWVILTGDFSGANLLVGFIFGYLALAVIQPQVPLLDGYAQRLPRCVMFGAFFLSELVKANFRVAFDIITPPWHMQPGVIAMPLEAKTDLEIAFVANVITLTPGTMSLDVSDDRRVLYIHAMFLDDEASLRSGLREMERRALAILR